MNGTITKRPLKGGKFSWGFVFDAGKDDAGKRSQPTKSGFTTKREASDALRDAIAEAERQRDAKARPDLPTFAEFFYRWIEEHAVRKCAPKTVERYRELGRYAEKRIGDERLDKITPMQAEMMINHLKDAGGAITKQFPAGRPLSAKSVRHIACVVHGCFEKALKWGMIERNPMDGVELPRAEKRKLEVLDRDMLGVLLQKGGGTRIFPFIVLAVSTGARRGELLALRWDDIDFETGIMQLTKSLEQTRAGLRLKSTKSGKPRRFGVPRKALEVLAAHRIEQDHDRELFGPDYRENALIFCRPDGSFYSPDRVVARVVEVMRKAGLSGASLHTLRHSHASELLSKGVPIPTVSKRLGHANSNVTLSIYAHALEADERAAAETWNDAMEGVITSNVKAVDRTAMLEIVSAKPSKKT